MPGTFSKLVTVVTGQTITASERNNEFDNIINNMTPDGVDDASANATEMQATTDPYPASVASQATDLRGEIKRLRYQMQLLCSDTYWYQDPLFLASLDATVTPAATAATLKVRLDHLAYQLKKLSGATNWYDAMAWLSALDQAATPGSTATDLKNRLDMIVTQIKAISGGANWYTAISNAMMALGGDQTATGVKTFSGQLVGKGTATNDSPSAGYIGELQSSYVGDTAFPSATNVWADLTNISLTAGDWDVCAHVYGERGSSTWTQAGCAISPNSGNDGTGLSIGDNLSQQDWASSSTTPGGVTMAIPFYRVSLSATTTYYLKYRFQFSAGTPRGRGRISARRRR
jgi:hypothetical protein